MTNLNASQDGPLILEGFTCDEMLGILENEPAWRDVIFGGGSFGLRANNAEVVGRHIVLDNVLVCQVDYLGPNLEPHAARPDRQPHSTPDGARPAGVLNGSRPTTAAAPKGLAGEAHLLETLISLTRGFALARGLSRLELRLPASALGGGPSSSPGPTPLETVRRRLQRQGLVACGAPLQAGPLVDGLAKRLAPNSSGDLTPEVLCMTAELSTPAGAAGAGQPKTAPAAAPQGRNTPAV